MIVSVWIDLEDKMEEAKGGVNFGLMYSFLWGRFGEMIFGVDNWQKEREREKSRLQRR